MKDLDKKIKDIYAILEDMAVGHTNSARLKLAESKQRNYFEELDEIHASVSVEVKDFKFDHSKHAHVVHSLRERANLPEYILGMSKQQYKALLEEQRTKYLEQLANDGDMSEKDRALTQTYIQEADEAILFLNSIG